MINPQSKVPFGEIHESQPLSPPALNSRLFLPLLSDIYLRRSRKAEVEFQTH